MPVIVHTIGHSSHAAGRFLALLQGAGIACLVDVRSQPASRYAPHFGREALRRWLAEGGVAYRWLGDALGGRPRDPAVYRPDGRVDYAQCAMRPAFRAGIADLLAIAAANPTAIMCAEREPLQCHRTHLVTPALLAEAALVRHILADGTCIDHAALQQPAARQPDLFD